MRYLFFVVSLCALSLSTASLSAKDSTATRAANRGLVALYDFSEPSGKWVRDRSGAGEAIDLQISELKAVVRGDEGLQIKGTTLLTSTDPAKRLVRSIKQSGAFTVEAWIRPENLKQKGPARIVTLSQDSNKRNFTLGQEGDRFEVRFRASDTSTNGLPSVSTKGGTVKASWQHVVYTRQKDGETKIYLNGKLAKSGHANGSVSNWDDGYRLALADEFGGGRQWLGTYRLLAIYQRDLSNREVKQNYDAGRNATLASSSPSPSETAAKDSTKKRAATRGLVALYDFSEPSGKWVRDRSGFGEAIDLQISDPNAITRSDEGLQIKGTTLLASTKPAKRLVRSIKQSGAFTVEAWIRPENLKQKGPARIVTVSKDSVNRDFTLGQEGDRFEVRFRASGTSTNGLPSISTEAGTAKTSWQHVVYTRRKNGETKIYLNGKPAKSGHAKGSVSNWDDGYRLALADEFVGGRPWLGTYRLIAIYQRDLTGREAKQNFDAGRNATFTIGSPSPSEIATQVSPHARMFETKVAPLLAKHCLECHESAVSEGGLNLARKSTAFAGGDSGAPIVAKNAKESLLWQSIEHDEMPHNRTPLSADEKKVLKDWINSGATWSIDFIDLAVYAHEGRKNQIWVQRLTVDEYINTVQATFGVDIRDDAMQLLPRDMRADGFNNTAYNLNVDLQHVDAYAKLAAKVTEQMDVRQFAVRFRKQLSLIDDDMRGLIETMGKWILRAPLQPNEIALYRGVTTAVASSGGSVDDAITYAIRAMIQSPRFVYRVENQRGTDGTRELDEYELASKLSYIIWGSSPDKELYAAAESGDLYDPDGLRKQADRMLKDRRAVERSLEFVSQWLNLARMDNLQPSPKRFPKWDAGLAQDMRNETLAFAAEVLWKRKRPLSDLLNAEVTFLTPELATHYGLKPKGKGQQQYDLTDVPSRGGLMTHGSVLTVGGDDASMVTRGLLVMHELLRGVVKDPPPGTDTTPVPSEPGLSQRSIALDRIANDACSGCHRKFEPLAFGLEKFDGVGAFHEVDEYGNQLHENGQVLIPGDSQPQTYNSSRELMKILASSERVKETLTWKVTQFALGRPLLAEDASAISAIHRQSQKTGGTYPALLSAIVASDLVRHTKTESE